MAYSIYLYRQEMKERFPEDFSFLEDLSLVLSFTDEQFEQLKERLVSYGYKIKSERTFSINFQKESDGTTAWLTKKALSFSSGMSQDGSVEIMMIASKFTDTGEFAKLDPQLRKWETVE